MFMKLTQHDGLPVYVNTELIAGIANDGENAVLIMGDGRSVIHVTESPESVVYAIQAYERGSK